MASTQSDDNNLLNNAEDTSVSVNTSASTTEVCTVKECKCVCHKKVKDFPRPIWTPIEKQDTAKLVDQCFLGTA